MVCKRVYYSGRVQGVGFRYTTRQIARNFAVTGYVKNLQSGSVEVVAEGQADQVDSFLDAIAQRMKGYIRDAQVQDCPPAGHADFSIQH